jgi:hypothetical protein
MVKIEKVDHDHRIQIDSGLSELRQFKRRQVGRWSILNHDGKLKTIGRTSTSTITERSVDGKGSGNQERPAQDR